MPDLRPVAGAHAEPDAGLVERVGLAVSGGPDSLALLLLAHAAFPGQIMAATVDHGLRADSAREAQVAAQYCSELGVPHVTLQVKIPAGNVQHEARLARYGALGGWMDSEGLGALVTAHHADDQAETVLMRMNRGSGLSGLSGIRSLGAVPGTELPLQRPLLRPLLGWRSSELAALVSAAGWEAVQDPSNTDDRFDRVRMRKALADNEWLDPLAITQSAQLLADALAYLADGPLAMCWAARVHIEQDGMSYLPGTSRFENIEMVARIMDQMAQAIRKSDVASMVDRLERGQNASLGGVLAKPQMREGEEPYWYFAAEPARASR